MKEKVNQLFRDKLVLVMLVLGLLTIVAAAGAMQIRRGSQSKEESPYLDLDKNGGIVAENVRDETPDSVAQPTDIADAADEEQPDTVIHEASRQEEPQAEPEKTEEDKPRAQAPAEEAGAAVSESLVLNFTEDAKLSWPVEGNVILGYSMDTTTYFPTLEQYKCNPANVIQSDVSTPVTAPADARVLEIGSNEEIGAYIRMDLGNGYTAICGQLKEIPVVENEYLHKGDVIGYIAEPTKYYSVEGNNLYFEFLHEDQPVDALDYLE